MINISKHRDPIAVWYLYEDYLKGINQSKEMPVQDFTLGWVEFNEKIKKEKLPSEVIENTRWTEQVSQSNGHIYLVTNFREAIKIGKYMVLDGLGSLVNKINTNKIFEYSNLTTTIFSTENGVVTILSDANYRNKKLFFTAPSIAGSIYVRQNILNGKQPIRTTSYYRLIENHSGDKTEALNKMTEFETIEIKGNNSIEYLSYEGYIFSLHDENIDPKEKEKFGDDTYEITDINKWIIKITNQVDKYWLTHAKDYVGFIVMLKVVEYNNEKLSNKITHEEELILNLKDFGFGETANLKGGNITFQKFESSNNFFESYYKTHFTKPYKYKGESETRLSIIPFFSNSDKDGFLLNRELKHHKFYMQIKDYESVIELKKD